MAKSDLDNDEKLGVSKGKLTQKLTLEEVCPTWARKMKVGLSKADRHILSHDSRYCLVGEAWGFTGRQTGYYIAPLIPFVGCWTCVKYGRAMGKESREKSNNNNNNTNDFLRLITEFLQHWNEKHRNITERLIRDKR
jgi:hypothetical protein